jgi:hypothetical protein
VKLNSAVCEVKRKVAITGGWLLFKEYYHRYRVAQWLRYCATNQKVAGSIPDGFIGIFH